MVAIDAAAARDRRLWPVKSKDTTTAGVSKLNRPQADTEAASPDSSIAVADVCAPGDVCIYTAQHTADVRTTPLYLHLLLGTHPILG